MSLGQIQNMEAPVVSGVTVDRDVSRVTLIGLPFDTQLVSKIFTAIAEVGVNVDIIVHNLPEPGGKAMHLGFTVSKGDVHQSINAIKKIWGPNPELAYTIEDDCAKVSVVGVGMRSHAGVAATTFAALSRANIDIRMISTSEIKISCVVEDSKVDDAARVLHRAFIAE